MLDNVLIIRNSLRFIDCRRRGLIISINQSLLAVRLGSFTLIVDAFWSLYSEQLIRTFKCENVWNVLTLCVRLNRSHSIQSPSIPVVELDNLQSLTIKWVLYIISLTVDGFQSRCQSNIIRDERTPFSQEHFVATII